MKLLKTSGCCIVFFALVSIITLSIADDEAKEPADKPDIKILLEKTAQSTKKLETTPASWAATTTNQSPIAYRVEVLTTPEKSRYILTAFGGKKKKELLRYIARDGVWYVSEGDARFKCRPWEAPINNTMAFIPIMRSELMVVTEDWLTLAEYESTDNGVATYRTSLDENHKERLKNNIRQFEELFKKNPKIRQNKELVNNVKLMKELIEKGIPARVDLNTGFILDLGSIVIRTEVKDFRWLEKVEDSEFAVSEKGWQDLTDTPKLDNLSNIIMITHCGSWRPGMKQYEVDGRILDITTGKYRRIPFEGVQVMPGCFMRDRSKVAVIGVDMIQGSLGVFEINLKTGENRRLGGETLSKGICSMPRQSPDGKTLLVAHEGSRQKLLEKQLYLVDLDNNVTKALGKPVDTTQISWLPDGTGLILDDRKIKVKGGKPERTIIRMDLDGKSHPIRKGFRPLLLGDGKTILFLEDRLWKTCDLKGGNVKLFFSGFKDLGFPTLSPDGKRLLMMRLDSSKPPVPVIIDPATGKSEDVEVGPGLWALPCWK